MTGKVYTTDFCCMSLSIAFTSNFFRQPKQGIGLKRVKSKSLKSATVRYR